jgi:hypothetical protein
MVTHGLSQLKGTKAMSLFLAIITLQSCLMISEPTKRPFNWALWNQRMEQTTINGQPQWVDRTTPTLAIK